MLSMSSELSEISHIKMTWCDRSSLGFVSTHETLYDHQTTFVPNTLKSRLSRT
jgi:hypothetical protein